MGAAIVRRIAEDTLSSDETSPLALARLCFVLGHLALKLLVYAEVGFGRSRRTIGSLLMDCCCDGDGFCLLVHVFVFGPL